ncbi:MAG TPA: 3'-5' exonuclease, partial [Patescibacteria group bacterium]|nr:3'-5' exonuclease [Patescibacteria group bacterium]
SGANGLEEERRLAYVGVTRARKRVFVSYAANRRIYNQWQSNLPSRFVEELPPSAVERQGESGLLGGTAEGGSSWSASWGNSYTSQRRREPPPAAPTWSNSEAVGQGAYKVGDRVFHQKFGTGAVVAVDGNKLEIAFDKAGTKKVIDSFVALA